MAKRKKSKILPLLLLLTAVVLIATLFLQQKSDKTADPPPEEVQTTYPELYQKEGLPEYPDAEVINETSAANLKDGVRVTLLTQNSVEKVSAFYEDQMRRTGWTAASQKLVVDGLYLGTFTKDDLFYQVTISRQEEGETRVSIIYAEE